MSPGAASSHPPRRRLQLVLIVGALLLLVQILRLAQIQLLDHAHYMSYADREHWGRVEIPAERGAILDRRHRILSHNVLARSVVVRTKSMFASARTPVRSPRGRLLPPPPVTDAERERITDSLLVATSRVLGPRVGQSPAQLAEVLRKRASFYYLERKMDADRESLWVRGALPAGVSLEPEMKRVRPMGQLAAEVLGSTDVDGIPLGGLERQFDDVLKGSPGWVTVFRDGLWKEHRIPERGQRPATPGLNLELTVDATYQAIVEERLHQAIVEHRARGGSVVLLDPRTGEILALANETMGAGGILAPTHNRAVADMFEPGSTFKMVAFAAGLEDQLIQFDTPLNCEGGSWYLGGPKPIHDDQHDHFGVVPAWYALMKSSNIGTAKVGLKLGAERFTHFARALGFGAATGVDLPGEAPGYLLQPGPNQERPLACMSFGQGVSVSLMQLALAYGTVANGGTLYRPHLVRALWDTRGHCVKTYKPEPVRRVMSEQTAATMRTMLRMVVDSGTARAAQLQWSSAGGKTGTAQKAAANHGGYGEGRYMSVFVGFMPADKPELVMATVIDEPRGQHYGGLVAAPVFKDVMEAIARSGHGPVSPPFEVVRPSRSPEHPQPVAPGIAIPDLAGASRRAAVEQLASVGLSSNVIGRGSRVLRTTPAADEVIPPGGSVSLFTEASLPAQASVPMVVGLTLREALGKLRESGMTVRIVGGGRVVRQEPVAGASAPLGALVVLFADVGR